MKPKNFVLGLTAILLLAETVAIGPSRAADLKSIFTSIVSISDVDGKQAQLERRIQDSLLTGQLTSQEAQNFKKELDRVSESEAAYKGTDGNLSPVESLKLMLELDLLSKSIESRLHDRKTTSNESSLTTRKQDLIKRIEDGHSSARLTDQEYSDLKYEFGRVNELEQTFRGNGTLTQSELLKLSLDLDHISGRLERQMHDRQISLDMVEKRREDLEKQLNKGLTDGQLAQAEADSMSVELQKLSNRILILKSYNRPLTADESLTLVAALDKVNSQLSAQINKVAINTTDLDNKRTDLDRRIAEALNSGKIVLSEAQVLQQDLAALEQREKESLDAQGNVNDLSRQRILVDLERLNNRLVRKLVWDKPVWPGVQATITDLGQRIAGSTTDSRISTDEAQSLRQELGRINTERSSFLSSDGALSAKESIQLTANLDKLSLKIENAMNDRDLVAPDIDDRQFQLDSRIADGIKNGKLTTEEATKYLGQMDRISAREASFRGTDGRLDAREKVLLALDLERTGSAIERDLNRGIVGPTLDERRKTIDQRMSFGTSTGRLSSSETEKGRTELQRIKTLESQYAASGSGFDASETLSLASEFERLSSTLEQQIKDKDMALPDVDKRQAELKARIEEGVNSGRLTLEEARDLKQKFDSINELEQKYVASGGLSFGERANLALELERLSSAIEHQMRDQQASIPDVYTREMVVDQKLADLVVAGKMTLDQAADFRLQLDVVKETEKAFRSSGGGLSYPEAMTLTNELDKIANAIDAKASKKVGDDYESQFSKTTARVNSADTAAKLKGGVANLKRELDRISQAKTAFAFSGGGLSFAEAQSLMKDLDKLNKEIDAKLGTGKVIAWSDIEARQKKLSDDISRGVISGRIKAGQAKEWRRQLDLLNTAKSAFQTSEGTLNYYETISLAQALDKLDASVKRQMQ